MTLRPDEVQMYGDINRNKEINRNITGAAKTATTLGLTALGAGLSSKIMPFLSEYIPATLALKGIQKVAPKFGAMLSQGLEQGLDLKEGLNFLKDQIGKQENKNDKRNIIEKYSPDMFKSLEQFIKSTGKNPRMAVLHLLNKNPSYEKVVKQIEKDTGQEIFDIVAGIFGEGGQPKKGVSHLQEEGQMQQGMEQPQPSQMQQGQQTPQQPQPQQGGGAGDQALMEAINKILNM